MEALPIRNIKWICPTAPIQSMSIFHGLPYAGWFDTPDFTEDALTDMEGLDASATHVAELLSTEPSDIGSQAWCWGLCGWLPMARRFKDKIEGSLYILAAFALPWQRLGHGTIPEEMNEVCNWLTTNLALDGSC
ncbi:hypothetical protein MKX01_040635 [Papaver californicum]|nr:hypothetical protein MKX01_040635 [Papaver californicum]